MVGLVDMDFDHKDTHYIEAMEQAKQVRECRQPDTFLVPS